jgi:transcriptional regulator with XRE-family HTH domain
MNGDKAMVRKLKKEIERRNEELHKFYEANVGEIIRRARMSKNYTQEAVAKGICSNTYISKLENNQIAVNKESLFLIMERVDVSKDIVDYPARIIANLEQALHFFIHHDVKNYQELIETLEEFDFGIIVEMIRFGYAILCEDVNQASKMYHEMYHYFTSMDDFAFSIFCLFAIDYNHLIQDYKEARFILGLLDKFIHTSSSMLAYSHYQRFINYGFMHEFATSARHYAVARAHFILDEVAYRIHHMDLNQHMFGAFESFNVQTILREQTVQLFSRNVQDHYHVTIAKYCQNPLHELSKIDDRGMFAHEKKYLICKTHYANNQMEQYQIEKGAFLAFRNANPHTPDYYQLLCLEEKKDIPSIKELIVIEFLPHATKIQSIEQIKYFLNRLSKMCFESKRYKDAALYMAMIHTEMDAIRGKRKADRDWSASIKPSVA